MHETSRLKQLADKVFRIESGGMAVDFIDTSQGLLRIGGMPDISKLAAGFGLDDVMVVVPAWEVSQAGDNYTGEEFIFWRAQVYGHNGREYIGLPGCVKQLKAKLEAVFPYFFDDESIHIVRKPWLGKWFIARPVEGLYKSGDLQIRVEEENINVTDRNVSLYNSRDFKPRHSPDALVEEQLAKVSTVPVARDALELIVVGSGNGFSGRSASLLARFGRRAVWIDPCAFPAQSLGDVGVHWDEITDILITHNHEDHMSGFSACLRRCQLRNKKLRLITGRRIFRVLKQQFSPLFPDMERFVAFQELLPGTPLSFDGITIDSRWNHHFLPYGTLGLKITAAGRTVGISGDTKFSSRINAVVKRPELAASWFSDCHLVLHEVDFFNPDGVHSYWEEVTKIRDAIQGKLYGYHSPKVDAPPIPLVKQGETFQV